MIRTDSHELLKWLNGRVRSLKQARVPYESLWSDIREVFEPALGKHLHDEDVDIWQANANRDDEKILNSTPRIKLHRLAAGLQSGITNQATSWFKFNTNDAKLERHRMIREYLDKGTEYIQRIIARSNIYPTLDQIYLRLGAFGNACAILVPDDDAEVRMILCDEGSYYLAENSRGRVDTCLRILRFTLSQLVEEFGYSAVPDWAKESLEAGSNEDLITVYNLIYPRSQGINVDADVWQGREFISVYWMPKSSVKKHPNQESIIDIRSFDYNPIIAPRWSVRGTTAYGCGPAQIALSDAKQLQSLELAKLRLVEQESNPSLLVPASMRGTPIGAGPGEVSFYNDVTGQGQNPIHRLFETRASIEAIQVVIQETEARISMMFFTDLFAMMLNQDRTPRQMTAREVNERASERVSLLGPILTRLNTDLLEPLVTAVWNICMNAALERRMYDGMDNSGLLDYPDEMKEKPAIEFVSKLHIEQQAADRLVGLYRLQEFVTGLAQVDPQIILKLDSAKMLEEAARSLNEHGVVRDKKEYEQIIQQQQQAQQQQMAMQQQQVDAQTVRDLAGAKFTDGTSALEAMAVEMGGLG